MRASLRSRALFVGLALGLPMSAFLLWLALRGADFGAVRAALGSADLPLVVLGAVAMACVTIGAGAQLAGGREDSEPLCRRLRRDGLQRSRRQRRRAGSGRRCAPGEVATGTRADRGRSGARDGLRGSHVRRPHTRLLSRGVAAVRHGRGLVGAHRARRFALLVVILLVLGAARLYTRRQTRDRKDERGLVRRLARDTLEGLAEPLGRRRGAALVAISLALWSVWATGAWLVARSLGIELTPQEAIFVTAAMNLGVAIPSSPGYIGTYEWLGVSVLTLLDVGKTEALAFAILLHAVWYFPTLVVGGSLLLRRGARAMWSASFVRRDVAEVGKGDVSAATLDTGLRPSSLERPRASSRAVAMLFVSRVSARGRPGLGAAPLMHDAAYTVE